MTDGEDVFFGVFVGFILGVFLSVFAILSCDPGTRTAKRVYGQQYCTKACPGEYRVNYLLDDKEMKFSCSCISEAH